MNKKIFQSIFIVSAFIALFTLSSILFIMHKENVRIQTKALENTMLFASHYLNEYGVKFVTDLDQHDYRVSLVDPEGTIIYDNKNRISQLDNQMLMPEFKMANQEEGFFISRLSKNFDYKILRYSIELNNHMVMYVSQKVDTILSIAYKLLIYFVYVAFLLSLISYLIAKKVTASILEPINTIDLNDPLASDVYDEIKPFVNKIVKQQVLIDQQIKELERKSNEFNLITKSMSEGLILLNKSGIIISMNKTAQNIFNVVDDCIGMHFINVDKDQYAKDAFINSAKNARKSIEFTKGDKYYQLHFNQIVVDGSLKGYAILIIDITDKSMAQKQRQEFTANVSHELKTPLQSVIGYAELIEQKIATGDSVIDFASKIKKQSTRLVSLIEDIIFLSRLDEGYVNNLVEQVSLKSVVHDVFELLSLNAQKKNISLLTEGQDDVIMPGVYRYILEAIYNLCDNAVKYGNENGKVIVDLNEDGKKVYIVIKDNGPGIPPEHQDRIFERFYRVDKSHSRQTGGTGLGLSIVKRVVLFHKGKIKLVSNKSGSTFVISFNKKKILDIVKAAKEQNPQDDYEKLNLEAEQLAPKQDEAIIK